MRKKRDLTKPKKSLRNILTFWFLFFSVVPLIFITGYSLSQFELAIDEELNKRLQGNGREIGVVFDELEAYLVRYGRIHATDPTLIYSMSTLSIPTARRLVAIWMANYAASRISLFDKDGRLRVALYKSGDGSVKSKTNLESGDVYLAESLLGSLADSPQARFRDIRRGQGLELIVYSKIVANRGRVVGYIEEIINIDTGYLEGLKKRLNLELVLFDRNFSPIVSTLEDFLLFPKNYFKEEIQRHPKYFFEVTGRGQPYGFLIEPIRSSQNRIYLGLAASKNEVENVLGGIQNALITVVAVIILLVLLTLVAATNMIVKPVNDLVEAARKIEGGNFGAQIPVTSETELGYLTETFNKMSLRIAKARGDLEEKIGELENANVEIQDAQSQLVQSAKMVSLGQLVAGVAHELNNPIGFIYSNMSHLKDYSERLSRLADVAEKDPKKIKKVKEEIEYDYIVQDLPKLIKSCEDGARRVRDIVLGLRNFSRMEKMGLQEVDLKTIIEDTLSLLVGELKTRVSVHVDFGKVPKVICYANQVNQVLVNIIGNAAQAIEKKGDIWISTRYEGSWAIISVKDNGIGMTEEQKAKIFDPFFTTKEVGKGTGLGLSISYGIIQNHGGEIEVETKKGKGTEFLIKLPLQGPPTDKESGSGNL